MSNVTPSAIANTIAESLPSDGSSSSVRLPAYAKLAAGFITRQNDRDVVTSTSRILVALTGNPHFADPAPTLAEVTAARDALLVQVNLADASRLTIARRRKLRPPLNALLQQLAQYVQIVAKGDRVVLTSSGFPLQRGRQPAGLMPVPQNLRLSRGPVSGQLRARCKPIAPAGAYQWRIRAVQSPDAWLSADPTLAANVVLTGLVPGTAYLVQVRAIGTRGPGDWSDAATQIAL